ncbi:MAG: HEAT repeat domain-containing protein [Planctomycetota bacterium]|nr:HEAT repeat domain-containing protein [Planctomycetota bacterium]
MLRTLLPLFLALIAAPAPIVGGAVVPDKKLDAAAEKLRRAVGTGSQSGREAALLAIVELEDIGGVVVLQTEYARASQKLRGKRDELVEKTFVVERKREMVEAMKVRARSDPSVDGVVSRLWSDIGELDADISSLRKEVDEHRSVTNGLGAATSSLFGRFGPGKYKKAAALLWKDAEGHPEYGVRIAAAEMLGRVGGTGTALRLHKLMAKVHRQRIARRRDLPKLEEKVRKFEARYQKEIDQGTLTRATQQQYAQIRAEPASIRSDLHKLAFLVAAAAEAGGKALAREEGRNLEKSIDKLVKAQAAGKGGLRVLTLDVFRHADSDAVRAELRSMLSEEEEPLIRAEIIEAQASLADHAAVPALIGSYLADESWRVRSSAVAALAALRDKEAIPALIARLDVEEGRVRTEIQQALESLTGKRLGRNAKAWNAWWADDGATFEVSEEPVELKGSLTAEERIGVTFFGIRTESQRVLFILDVSGSMNFSMIPRENPADDTRNGRQPDMPRSGEDSRLGVARRELIKALGGIRDGGAVNIVLYATDVWSWSDELVTVDTEMRSEIIRYVEALSANGATNIWGALQRGLDLAGAEEGDGDEWSAPAFDTIYLLSDGRATAGVTTNPDEILSYVRERNRSAGITIHTIGLSGAQDAYLMRSLAEQNGGQYVAQ